MLVSIALLAMQGVVELTSENWDSLVTNSGKNAFVKFYAPWCGHCKALKPDWDRLGEQFADESQNVLVGDVDCTGSGKTLCETHGVKGYPTLKTFWKQTDDDYGGKRDFESLVAYAEQLGPVCSPTTLDVCPDERRRAIEEWMALDAATLQAMIDEHVSAVEASTRSLTELRERLQAEYEEKVGESERVSAEHMPDLKMLRMLATPSEEAGAKEEL